MNYSNNVFSSAQGLSVHIVNLQEHGAFVIFGLCSRAAPSMLTIVWGLKMINFAPDHPSKEIALIRKIVCYSANQYAFRITGFFF